MKSFKEHMLPMTMAKKNAIVGVREDDLPVKEGTMTVPDTKKKQQGLKKVLQKQLKAKDANKAIQSFYDDDTLFDDIEALPGNKDAREVIIQHLRSYGPNKSKSWWEIIQGIK